MNSGLTLANEERVFRSYNQTKFFESYVIVVIIPTGACQPVALWSCIKQGLWRVPQCVRRQKRQ